MQCLTSRQIELLQLIANGLTYNEIALILEITPHTIKNHMSDVKKRIGSTTRIEAIMYAASLGLIDLKLAQFAVKNRIESRIKF